jgi:hypothetical protein
MACLPCQARRFGFYDCGGLDTGCPWAVEQFPDFLREAGVSNNRIFNGGNMDFNFINGYQAVACDYWNFFIELCQGGKPDSLRSFKYIIIIYFIKEMFMLSPKLVIPGCAQEWAGINPSLRHYRTVLP